MEITRELIIAYLKQQRKKISKEVFVIVGNKKYKIRQLG